MSAVNVFTLFDGASEQRKLEKHHHTCDAVLFQVWVDVVPLYPPVRTSLVGVEPNTLH